jgi:hypothetical protein
VGVGLELSADQEERRVAAPRDRSATVTRSLP